MNTYKLITAYARIKIRPSGIYRINISKFRIWHPTEKAAVHETASLMRLSLCLWMVLAALFIDTAFAESSGQDYSVTARDGTELGLMRYTATGDYLIVWLAPGYGIHRRSTQTARRLADNGIEVWQIDLAEALFLPHSTDQMRAFTGQYIADLIDIAHAQTKKKIVLAARSYGAIPLLRGARIWQSRQGMNSSTTQTGAANKSYLTGALLFSPDLYTTIPTLGLEPEYLPITSASNIPIIIFQDGNRGNRGYVDRLINSLMKGGSKPLLKIFPGVTGLFFNQDEALQTLAVLEKLPAEIQIGIKYLESMPSPLQPAPMKGTFKPVGSGLDSRLKVFKGNFPPLPIDLKDSNGASYQKKDYRGQVTVVNFWASWCSPCVKEIPSLNRLRAQLHDIPFELISINYAESAQTILEFMKQVAVKYPVLLDTTGQVSVKWNVITFPSTFVIGPDGKIHYGVNAAIHWDNPNVVSALRQLFRKYNQR
jgi:thiol-disulfide isomerase/thioredoxin